MNREQYCDEQKIKHEAGDSVLINGLPLAETVYL